MKENKECFVYFIKCKEFVKIGHTTNVRQRVMEMQTANPYDLELILLIHYDSRIRAVKDERRLHITYKDHRVRGEWFVNIDVMADWPKIHALTYAASKYETNINFNELQNKKFKNENNNNNIPLQGTPLSDMRAARNSISIIYHLLFLHTELRKGSKTAINDLLDFPVSIRTITRARNLFKKYINKTIPHEIASVMLYINRFRPSHYPTKAIMKTFGVSEQIVQKAKKYEIIHIIAREYGQNTYE